MKQILFIGFLLFSLTTSQQAQKVASKSELSALNDYVQFTNESIHGLLIVHRLLENFNQEINKYVDLDGEQFNYYSNKDITFDIFDDPDHWFYEKSPYEWYNSAKLKSRGLPEGTSRQLHGISTEMKEITTRVNALRFKLDQTIDNSDLTDRAQLQKVYDLLETGVSLYDEFYALTKNMKATIAKAGQNTAQLGTNDKELMNLLLSNHDATWNILDALRNKNDENFEQLINVQRKATGKFVNYKRSGMSPKQYTRRFNNIMAQSKDVVTSAVRFYDEATVDEEYKLYGKFYFYHNSDVINKFNRYGNGYVYEINQLIEVLDLPVLNMIEVPHYYKVIYPEKMNESGIIASTDPDIKALPKKLKSRKVINSKYTINADTTVFLLKLYESMIQDDDIVSINFNGDWILENYKIEAKPTVLNLQLNKEGKNYLLVHAETIGKRPPNTVGLSYDYNGEKVELKLRSDLKESEMIEIILDDDQIIMK